MLNKDKGYECEAIDFSTNLNVLFHYRIPKFYNLLYIDKNVILSLLIFVFFREIILFVDMLYKF